MAEPNRAKMVIPSQLAEISTVEKQILRQVRAHDYPERAVFAIRLALEEALSNAIKHGNQADPKKQVTVEYAVGPEEVRISVWDEGHGFEPGQLPDPRREEHLTDPRGRGVLLMRAYMSEVYFNERGNCVTLVKRRGDVDAPPAAS